MRATHEWVDFRVEGVPDTAAAQFPVTLEVMRPFR